MDENFVLISGCSGGGKSTLLNELRVRGHHVVEEPGRRIVREELAGDHRALPWVDPAAFARRAIEVTLADRRGIGARCCDGRRRAGSPLRGASVSSACFHGPAVARDLRNGWRAPTRIRVEPHGIPTIGDGHTGLRIRNHHLAEKLGICSRRFHPSVSFDRPYVGRRFKCGASRNRAETPTKPPPMMQKICRQTSDDTASRVTP